MSLRGRSVLRTLTLAALLPLAALACGGGGGDGPAGPNNPNNPNNPNPNNPNPVSSAAVAMESGDDGYGSTTNRFTPESVILARNGTVTWTNGTGIAHSVVFSGANAPQNIGVHTTGSNSRTFSTAGTYNYQCGQHATMSGTVTVQ